MRILIYGAGVIGSLYRALLSAVDLDVMLYARGRTAICKSGLAFFAADSGQKSSVSHVCPGRGINAPKTVQRETAPNLPHRTEKEFCSLAKKHTEGVHSCALSSCTV